LTFWLICNSVSSSFAGVLSNTDMPKTCIISSIDKVLLRAYFT
jgi:hypothetical protein